MKVRVGVADYLRTLESTALHQNVLASLLGDRAVYGQFWDVAS